MTETMMSSILRIGNASAFWGDDPLAPARLAAQAPEMDVLTLDYLAEVSMSILAKQRQRDPSAGFPRDFLDVIRSLTEFWKAGRRLRVVTNAGGLSPRGCALACAEILRAAGCSNLKLGIVTGDDVLPMLGGGEFRHLETNQPISTMAGRIVTANAYLGAEPLVDALKRGADIVITGRVADPSLTVAPSVAHFGWASDDYPRIAGATIAGHLIECGTQVTGGISTHWLELDPAHDIGFPIAEVSDDGSCVITKPAGTGGRVDERAVKEQLLYEIGDPDNYLSPDASVSFLKLKVEDLGNDRVRVSGAVGRPPTDFLKVSATYRAGYRAAGTLTIYGPDAAEKARRCGRIVLRKVTDAGCCPQRSLVEVIGGGDVVPGVPGTSNASPNEVVLRIAVADESKDVVERFARQLAPLVTAGPQGTTGYAEGRPPVREIFGYWPTLMPRDRVRTNVEMLEI